MRRFSSK